ncbi:RBM34 protein, partial [Turnix velox]|nr:RBM34 protein [Turnix velox]
MAARRRAQAPARDGGGEGYAVGQVADSLRLSGATVEPLARLFSAAAAPPVLVAVAGANKKRKHTEPVEKASEDQRSSIAQEPPVKAKKARKREISKAEKTLGDKESTLQLADEEEEQKLLQKRKAKQTKGVSHANTSSGVSSDNDTTTTPAVVQPKLTNVDRRTVFVGNLPVSCTPQALKSLFKEYGKIKSIRFWSLVALLQNDLNHTHLFSCSRHKVHPNAKVVNAYVVFNNEDDAMKALNENGREFASGFHLRVDIASKASPHDKERSVFLGNLSYDISDDAVREHFTACGDVVAVRVVRDRNTGLAKGFGFVRFQDTHSVHLALRLNESVLMGRKIRVKQCGEKWKTPQKNPAQPCTPKGKVGAKSKNKKRSNDSFVGEKANPLKKNTKQKRLKTTLRYKAGKNK